MDNIITLDQPTAATMTQMRGLLNVYRHRNKSGRYDEAVTRYTGIYDCLMDEVLGRQKQEEQEAA